MIFAENNECSGLLLADADALDSMMNVLEESWSGVLPVRFDRVGTSSEIAAEKLEVLLAVGYWDAPRKMQFFKLLCFSDTMGAVLRPLREWVPPASKFVQAGGSHFTA